MNIHPQVEELIEDFIAVLNKKATTLHGTDNYQVEYGRKLAKIFAYEGINKVSMHAFVNMTNGDVIKAATLKSPQRNADGTYAVRFNLVDPQSREMLFEKAEFSGGYLYLR